MDIRNKTSKPLRVPLSGGKRLFLVPGGKGQIAPKAAEEPAVKALLDDGSIEIEGIPPSKRGGGAGGAGGGGVGPSEGAGGGGLRHTGDR